MIFGQLAGRSPQGKTRNIVKYVNQTPLYHMNCLQLSKVRLHYDDVLYQTVHVSRIILVGRIIQVDKGTSARGMAMLNLKIQDSTGKITVSFYQSEELQATCRKADYVKISLTAKCAGLVYRPEIKFMGIALSELKEGFNELTSHYLQCIRTHLKAT